MIEKWRIYCGWFYILLENVIHQDETKLSFLFVMKQETEWNLPIKIQKAHSMEIEKLKLLWFSITISKFIQIR